MGLFDFVKEAGKKLGLVSPEKSFSRGASNPQRGKRDAERAMAGALRDSVHSLGLEVEQMRVTFQDGTATVQGIAPTQEIREKVVLVLGNTLGVARVDDQMDVREAQPEAVFYTVKRGDTLWKIAKIHYGNGSQYMEIFQANQPLLTDPDKIYPGQVLRIPGS